MKRATKPKSKISPKNQKVHTRVLAERILKRAKLVNCIKAKPEGSKTGRTVRMIAYALATARACDKSVLVVSGRELPSTLVSIAYHLRGKMPKGRTVILSEGVPGSAELAKAPCSVHIMHARDFFTWRSKPSMDNFRVYYDHTFTDQTLTRLVWIAKHDPLERERILHVLDPKRFRESVKMAGVPVQVLG